MISGLTPEKQSSLNLKQPNQLIFISHMGGVYLNTNSILNQLLIPQSLHWISAGYFYYLQTHCC